MKSLCKTLQDTVLVFRSSWDKLENVIPTPGLQFAELCHRAKRQCRMMRRCLEALLSIRCFIIRWLKSKSSVLRLNFFMEKTEADIVGIRQSSCKDAAIGKTHACTLTNDSCAKRSASIESSIETNASTSRPDENIAKVHELVLEDRFRTINKLIHLLSGVSWSSCQRNLRKELKMKRITARQNLCPAYPQGRSDLLLLLYNLPTVPQQRGQHSEAQQKIIHLEGGRTVG